MPKVTKGKTKLSKNTGKSSSLSDEELNKIKTLADYLFMDQYQDMGSFPRFEECFGGFFINNPIDLPMVFKIICGQKKKYITFRRLINSYKEWKKNPSKFPKDYQNFMNLLYKDLLKESDKGAGNQEEKIVYFNTWNSINRKAISKFTVITDEDKTTIKGFRIFYDDFFKNDLFLNKENEKYFVTLEINLIADNVTNSEAQKIFPTENDRDGISHLGGTYNNEGINFLVFKCRSGKTSFIGKPNGTPFLYGSYKKQLKTIKIGVKDSKLFYIEPHFETIERFNPKLDLKVEEVTDTFLKQDKPIYEETILVNVGEEEAEKNVLQPLVSDDRFYNSQKYQDRIGGIKFNEICPIVSRFWQKDPMTNKGRINIDVKGLLEEAGKLFLIKQERIGRLKQIGEAAGKGQEIIHKISEILPPEKGQILNSVGDFLQNPGKFDSLLGKIGSQISNEAEKLGDKGIVGNLISGAVSGIGSLLKSGKPKNQVQLQQPQQNQNNTESNKLRGRTVRIQSSGFGGIGQVINTFNNFSEGFFGFSPFGGSSIGSTTIFSPFGFSGISSSSGYFIDDSYQKEMEERKRQQEEIRRQHEEEMRRRLSDEQIRIKMQKAQILWKAFYEKMCKDQGIYIIQTIGAVIKALTLLKNEEAGIRSNYSIEEKIQLFQILKANRNIVMMLCKAHQEAMRRKMEQEQIQVDRRQFEKMKEEEERREAEEKKKLELEKKRKEEEKKITEEKARMEEEKKKREEEMKQLMIKIQQERDAKRRRELERQEQEKKKEEERRKAEEARKKRELEEQQRKIEEEKRIAEEEAKRIEEEKKRKQEEAKRKAEEEERKREEEEAKIIASIQEKKTLNANDLPMINEKLEQISEIIRKGGLSLENIRNLQDYYNELLKQKNAIVEALNKEEKRKMAEQMQFDAEEAKRKDEAERKRLKEEEDKKIEKQRQEEEAKRKEKTKIVSISNVEIPENTKTWRNQKMAQPGTLYSDEIFPPMRKSLCPVSEIGRWEYPEDITQEDLDGWENIKWDRAENIFGSKNYQVFFEGVKKEDIIQGGLGDCYFLSAIAALCKFPELIEKLFLVKEKSNEHCYGCYFRVNGIWQLVLVDDYIPCYGSWGKNFSFSSTNGNELWVIILEKAWAKLNGSYAKAIGGEPQEVFDVITNSYSEKFKIKSGQEDKLWTSLITAEKNGFIMTAGTSGDTYNLDIEEVGLVPGHAYTILGVKEFSISSEKLKLIHIRNPWGNGEWSGDWSDSSRKWTDELRKACGQNSSKNDGSFWMSFQDFCRYYVVGGICHLYLDFKYSFYHVKKEFTAKGPFFTRVEVQSNNTKCYLMLHQKNPRIILKTGDFQKPVVCYIMLVDSEYKFIAANNNEQQNIAIEVILDKGTYYMITDANFRYVQKTQHCYNLSSYASTPVGIFPEENKNIEEAFKYGIYSYCKSNRISPQSHKDGYLYQSKRSESEFPFSFLLYDNSGSYDVTIMDSLSFRGQRNADYYFEGNKNSSSSITKVIAPGQWDVFCHMPYTFGALYSYGLQTSGRSHSGPSAKRGLASLSGGNSSPNSPGGLNYSQSESKSNTQNDYSDVFKEEGEDLDTKGLIKQYVHPTKSEYQIGFENGSKQILNMRLVLNGLYEVNNPRASSVTFSSNPKTRRVFILKPKEGSKQNISFMFEQA